MKAFVVSYAAAGAAFLAIDFVWLSLMAERFYRPLLGDRLAENFHVAPAVVFYLIYIFGVVALAVLPALKVGRVRAAAVNGAILGLVAYATYDLTNHATLKDWPVVVTITDVIWGTALTCVASVAGFLAARRRAA